MISSPSTIIFKVAGGGKCKLKDCDVNRVDALLVKLDNPNGIWGDFDAQIYYVADTNDHVIRKFRLHLDLFQLLLVLVNQGTLVMEV